MSTVREHIEDLRKIATTLEQRGESGHGNRQNSPHFQFAAILLCGVHLDELEAMVNDRRPPADLTDTQIKALVDSSPELACLEYGAAYKLVRKIEAAANAGVTDAPAPSMVGVGTDQIEPPMATHGASHLYGVPGTFICRRPAIGPACEKQCERCAADGVQASDGGWQ